MKKVIKINGIDFTDIFTPVGYSVTYRKTRGKNAGDLMDGGYVDDILAVKAVITCTCMPTTEEQLSRILSAVLLEYVEVYFFDPWINEYRKAVMLPSEPSQKFRGTGANSLEYWTGTVLQFTERDGGVKKNKLVYNGTDYEELESASSILEDSLPLDELPVDTMTSVVRDYSLEDYILSGDDAAGDGTTVTLPLSVDGYLIGEKLDANGLKTYNYGETVRYYHEKNLIGKFYLELIKRIGRTRWQFQAKSGVGLLTTSYHWGGMYAGETAAVVIADIISGIIPYSIDSSLSGVGIYGWLGKGSRRDNLRNVLFAIGGRIAKDASGDVKIISYVDETPREIGQSSFYLSGGSVTDGALATEIRVTEHSYFVLATDEETTIYDGVAVSESIVTPKGKTVNGVLLDFPEPFHDLTITGASILESGVNYAVISNSSRAVLTGKRYTHTQRIIPKVLRKTGAPNIVSSSECGLINFMNSENVANRLAAFYGSSKSIEADIVLSGEKPGDIVTFTDPFGDKTKAYIESLDVIMSNTLKARASFVADFIPPDSGNKFTHRVVLTGSGSWTPPSGVMVIRYALFGGACGGRV